MTTARGDALAGTPTAHSSTRMPAHRPADDRVPPLDAERVGERGLDRDLVADRDAREARPVRRAVAGSIGRRTGRALAAAEHVRAHDEEAVGVDRRARARSAPSHQPASPWPGPARPGGVAVAGERVQHEHRVRRVGRERAPRLVRDRDRLEPSAGLERERPSSKT